jgi:hypothetical protein
MARFRRATHHAPWAARLTRAVTVGVLCGQKEADFELKANVLWSDQFTPNPSTRHSANAGIQAFNILTRDKSGFPLSWE